MHSFLKTAAVLLITAFAAQADEIVVTLDNPNQTGYPGETLSFSGVISNPSADTDPDDAIYLNSDTFDLTLSGASYSLNDDFFSNVPVDLAGGQSSTDVDLFDITLSDPVADPFGLYTGTYTLLGGPDFGNQSDFEIVSQTSFSILLAPEPETWMLLPLGLLVLAAARRLTTA